MTGFGPWQSSIRPDGLIPGSGRPEDDNAEAFTCRKRSSAACPSRSMHPLLVYRNWTQILRARKHAHGEECRLDSIDTEIVAEKVAIDLIPPRVASRRQLTPHPAFGHPLPRERGWG